MTIIRRLELHNFKSHKDSSVDFIPGRIIIVGENGAGKSSMEQGIAYAFFAGTEIKDLVGDSGAKFNVVLDFEVAGKYYRVERSNGQGLKPEAYLYHYPNGVTGKRDIIAEEQTKVTTEVLRIMGASEGASKDIKSYIVVPQNQIQSIISEQPAVRQKFFDNLFKISDYETTRFRLGHMNGRIQKKVEDFRKEIALKEENVQKIPETEEKRTQALERIKSNQATIHELGSEITKKRAEFAALEKLANQLQSTKDKIAQVEETVNKLKKDQEAQKASLQNKSAEALPALTDGAETVIRAQIKKNEEAIGALATQIEEQNSILQNLKEIKGKIEEKKGQLTKTTKDQEKAEKDITVLKDSVGKLIKHLPWLKPPEKDWPNLLQNRTREISDGLQQMNALKSQLRPKLKLNNSTRAKIESATKNLQDRQAKYKRSLTLLDKKFLNGTEIESYFATLQKSAAPELLVKLEQKEKDIEQQIVTNQEKSTEIKTQVKLNQDTIKELKSLPEGGKCPCCKQTISADHSLQEIKRLQHENGAFAEQVKEFAIKIQKFTELQKDYEIQIKSFHEAEKILVNFTAEKEKVDELKNEITKLEGESSKLETDINQAVTDIKKIISHYKFLSFENQGESLETAIETKVEEYTQEKDQVEELQRNLKNMIEKQEKLEELKTDLNNLQKSIKDLEKQYSQERLDTAEKNRQDYQLKRDRFADFNGKLALLLQVQTQIQQGQTTLDKYQRDLAKIYKNFDDVKYAQLKDEVSEQENKLTSLQTSLEELQQNFLPQIEDNLRVLQKMKQDYDETQKNLQLHLLLLKDLEYYIRFFEEIQTHVRHQFVRQTSIEATQLLHDMVEMPDFSEIEITDEYELKVNRFGQKESLTRLSGGEKMVMSLAIRIAIAKLLSNQDLILLDEPTESLDSERIHTVVDCFSQKSPLTQIFIITHDQEFERVADLVVRVKKDMGHSKVEVINR